MVAESLRPGINISDLARRCGVNAGLLQTWRRKARQEAAVFIPLHVEGPGERTDEAVAAAAPPSSPVVAHPSPHFSHASSPASPSGPSPIWIVSTGR